MRIESALVANAAEAVNGLLNVAGAGWENYDVGLFPGTFNGVVCGILTVDASEGAEPVGQLYVTIGDDGGQLEAATASGAVALVRPTIIQDSPGRIPFVVPFSTIAKGPTTAKISLTGLENDVEIRVIIRDTVPDDASGLA